MGAMKPRFINADRLYFGVVEKGYDFSEDVENSFQLGWNFSIALGREIDPFGLKFYTVEICFDTYVVVTSDELEFESEAEDLVQFCLDTEENETVKKYNAKEIHFEF